MANEYYTTPRDCPRCGAQLPNPFPNDPFACAVCGWGDWCNADKRKDREFDSR